MNSEQKELLNSITKATASFIPGLSIPLEFIEYRAKIKQNRIHRFIESFQDYLAESNLTKKFEFDLLNNENFTDLFESVIRRVSLTRSITKLQSFKLILANSIGNKSEISFSETFLDLVFLLHEKEMEILKSFHNLYERLNGKSLVEKNNSIHHQLSQENDKRTNGIENNYIEIKTQLKEFQNFRNPSNFNITKGQYNFFVQNLASKCLLVDIGIGAIDTKPYDLMEITDFGKQFIEFIDKTQAD